MAFDFPSSPTNGQVFIPVAGGPSYSWNGTAWVLTSGGVSGGVYIGDTAPVNPVAGQLWWESDSGNTFIYYVDASSSQWVQFNVTDEQEHLNRIVRTVFTASGTYTKPTGLKFLEVTVIGAGGGVLAIADQATNNIRVGSGGGGGGAAIRLYAASELAASEAFTVGLGVVGGTGATSTFKGLTASGGIVGNVTTAIASGAAPSASPSGGNGGTGAGGQTNIPGGRGETGVANAHGVFFGYAGGGGGSHLAPPQTGSYVTQADGGTGYFPGGGARAATARNAAGAAAGAAGGNGMVILTEYF